MLKGELKKLFNIKIIVIFILFLGAKFLVPFFMTTATEYEFSKDFYKDYCEEFEGVYSNEKSENIDKEIKKLSDIIDAQSEMENRYTDNQISFDEFNRYNKKYTYADSHLSAIKAVKENAEYFERISPQKNPEFFYDLNCKEFFENFGIDSICVFFLIFLCTNYFFLDKDNDLCDLIKSMPEGRKKYRKNQFAAVIIFTVAFTFLFTLYDILHFYIKCGAQDFTRPLCSLPQFESCGYNINILEFLLLNLLMRILWGIFLSALILFSSRIIKQFTSVVICHLFIVFLPVMFERLIPDNLNKFIIGKQLSDYAVVNNQIVMSTIISIVFASVLYCFFICDKLDKY